jgi:hypothetical protein
MTVPSWLLWPAAKPVPRPKAGNAVALMFSIRDPVLLGDPS